MSIDFRLQGKDNDGLLALFPKTSVQAITGADNYYKKVELQVNIPVPNGGENIQTIDIKTDKKMSESSFNVFLLTNTEQGNKDYSTIDQIDVSDNTMTIIRLSSMPKEPIDVSLVFYEKGID